MYKTCCSTSCTLPHRASVVASSPCMPPPHRTMHRTAYAPTFDDDHPRSHPSYGSLIVVSRPTVVLILTNYSSTPTLVLLRRMQLASAVQTAIAHLGNVKISLFCLALPFFHHPSSHQTFDLPRYFQSHQIMFPFGCAIISRSPRTRLVQSLKIVELFV